MARYWRDPRQAIIGNEKLHDDADKGRAVARAGIPLLIICSGAILAVWPILIDRIANGFADPRYGPAYAQEVGWGVAACAALVVAGVVIRWTIIHFNAPKFMVPPYFRADLGYREVLRTRAVGKGDPS